MPDIVERLRKWTISRTAVPCGDLMDEAADEIERLRPAAGSVTTFLQKVEYLETQIDLLRSRPCPYVTGTVTKYCALTPFTLTDAEREAVMHAMAALDHVGTDWTLQCAATLRGLLERLSPPAT